MGSITKYLISIVITIFISITLIGTLYEASTNSNKEQLSISYEMQEKIENSTAEIQRTLVEDTQTDPNDPFNLAYYFSKTLAILGSVVAIIINAFTQSIALVQSILLNITKLEAPFNIMGMFVSVGITILTIIMVFKAASIFFKFEM